MDEYKGNFRVVMTEGNMWDDKNPSKNHLYILNENMETTGSVKGLAEGERIYSARFMGDKAYMVTFQGDRPAFRLGCCRSSKSESVGRVENTWLLELLAPIR